MPTLAAFSVVPWMADISHEEEEEETARVDSIILDVTFLLPCFIHIPPCCRTAHDPMIVPHVLTYQQAMHN